MPACNADPAKAVADTPCDRCSAPSVYRDATTPDTYCAECAAYVGAHRRGEQYAALEALGFAVGLLRNLDVPGDKIAAAVHAILSDPASEGTYPVGGDMAALGRDHREDHPELTGLVPLERIA